MLDSLASLTALPNLHPALVLFPVALVFTALAVEGASLVLKRQPWLDRAAALLYALALASAGAAYLAGRQAADTVGGIPAAAEAVLAKHSDFALWTLVVLAVAAVLRVTASVGDRNRAVSRIGALRTVGLVTLLAGAALVARTADLGGSLVFRQGVGVAQTGAKALVEPEGKEPSDQPSPASGDQQLLVGDDGSLVWQPRPEDASVLGTTLRAADGGTLEAVRVVSQVGGNSGLRLALTGAAVLCFSEAYGDVVIEAVVDLSGFEGIVGLGHHIHSIEDGVFFTVESSGQATLTVRSGGSARQLVETSIEERTGSTTLVTSVAGRHLKGQINDQVVVHGHESSGNDGLVGILLDGRGEIGIERITVTPLSHG